MMRRALALALAFLLGSLPAGAQTPLLHGGKLTWTGGGGGYTGIGDLSVPGTAVGYWGGDCYTKTGTQNVAQVYYTPSTNVTALIQCVSGVMTLTAQNSSGWTWSTFQADCLTTSCFGTYVYDQTSSNLCTTATCDMQSGGHSTTDTPYIVYRNGTTCNGSTAGGFCLSYPTTTAFIQTINHQPTEAQPFNWACVGSYVSDGTDQYYLQTSGGGVLMNLGGGGGHDSYFAYAGNYQLGGVLTSGSWQMTLATYNDAGTGVNQPVTQLNNGAPNTGGQSTNTMVSTENLSIGFNSVSMVGACYVTGTAVFGTSAIASIYSTWKSHWGGGMP